MKAQLWNIRPQQDEQAQRLAQENVPELAAAVLAARGYDERAADALMRDGGLHDPMLLRDMDRAATTVAEAIEQGESICVYGDYDCDGVSATAMVTGYLEQIGARVCYYIPNREREGYGLNKPALDQLAQLGVTLLLTVDNGVSALEEVAYANTLGMRVVVTDHHKPRETLPEAAAVIDPHRTDCDYPFKDISGVGVAFKLLCALEGECGYGLLEQYADLLALGTVADVVSLTDENRFFVRRGLERLRECERPGLRALLEIAGVEPSNVTAESISFGLAPRINAAGRIDTADLAAMLLLTESESEAKELAKKLEVLNQTRRTYEKQVVDDVAAQLAQSPLLATRRIIVLSGEGWNAGIVGIVCSRLVERFDRPVLLIAQDGENAKGSGRSVEGFSLIDAVHTCGDCLTHYGGHPMAAGFSLDAGRIDEFARRLEEYAADQYPEMPIPRLVVDCVVSPEQLTVLQVETLSCLEPFGTGNDSPVFAVLGARLEQVMELSQGKHVKLRLSKGPHSFFVLCFFTRAEQLGVSCGDLLDVAFSVSINEYKGTKSVSMKRKAFRLAEKDQQALYDGQQKYERYLRAEERGSDLLATREETAVIYRYLRQKGELPFLPEALYFHIPWETPMDYAKFRVALDVMLELELLNLRQGENGRRLCVNKTAQKVCLDTSSIVRSLMIRT